MKNIKIFRWLLLISGILTVILGISMMSRPFTSLLGIALYIGILILFSGISEVASFFSQSKEKRSFGF